MIMYRALPPTTAVIDAGTTLDALTLATAALPNRLPREIVCDLRRTQHLDLDGFAWLVELSVSRSRLGGRLVLLGPPPEMSGVLPGHELEQLFEWAPDLGTALRSGAAIVDTHLRLGR